MLYYTLPGCWRARPHTDTGEEMTQVWQCSVYTVYCVTSTRQLWPEHRLFAQLGAWWLAAHPLPILLLVSSHRSQHTEVIAIVWATLDIELSAGVTNLDFSGISNRSQIVLLLRGRGLQLTPTPMRAECPLKLPEWSGASSPCRRHSPAENHEKGESLLQIKQLICMSHATSAGQLGLVQSVPRPSTIFRDSSHNNPVIYCP